MNPSPSAADAIRLKVADWAPPDAAVAAALNAPSVANPSPQGRVPKPFYASDILGALSPTSTSKLVTVAFIARIRDDINATDRGAVGLWCQVLAAGGIITPAECQAVMVTLAETVPDPSWTPQISWAQANLGRPVDAADISAARPPS